MSPIEYRIFILENFELSNIDIDEVGYIEWCIKIRNIGDKCFSPFNLDKIPEDVTEEDGYSRGEKLPEKLKLKQINM